jgi:protocatechuate 3,4-dioxygenase alpha subunit
VRVEGRVLDGAGDPIPDALVETWHPDPPAFARCTTDDEGRWFVVTPRAGHLDVNVFARGLLHHLVTRLYFDVRDVPEAVPAARRETLLARPAGGGYRFDIRIQGPGETVFFETGTDDFHSCPGSDEYN